MLCVPATSYRRHAAATLLAYGACRVWLYTLLYGNALYGLYPTAMYIDLASSRLASHAIQPIQPSTAIQPYTLYSIQHSIQRPSGPNLQTAIQTCKFEIKISVDWLDDYTSPLDPGFGIPEGVGSTRIRIWMNKMSVSVKKKLLVTCLAKVFKNGQYSIARENPQSTRGCTKC